MLAPPRRADETPVPEGQEGWAKSNEEKKKNKKRNKKKCNKRYRSILEGRKMSNHGHLPAPSAL